ncbi:MAG: class I SAM-dependent methyltransferase [Thermoplasmataceae archaeon]
MQNEAKPDYGTYHHSSKKGSDLIRDHVQQLFNQAFSSTSIARSSNISILDVGGGLGFISSIAAEFFNVSRITCIDTFKDGSLKGSSIERGRKNMELLDLSGRVSFMEQDILQIDDRLGKFDLAVSNLVLHNLGKGRFEAYKRIARVLNEGGVFINGDLFLQSRGGDPFQNDLNKITKFYRVINHFASPESGIGKPYHVMVLKPLPSQINSRETTRI